MGMDYSNQLIFSVSQNDKGMVTFLIENGADINFENSFGHTPLSKAIENCNEDMVHFLIANGADVNYVDPSNTTPLGYAIIMNAQDIILLLLEKGADVNCINNIGCSPLMQAIMFSSSIAEPSTLIELGLPASEVERIAARWKNPQKEVADIVSLLLKNGADLYYKSPGNITPIDYAFQSNNKNLISLLLEQGVDINYEGTMGTPLRYAIYDNNYDMVNFLIDKGANINYVDSFSQTPLYHAILANNTRMVELLIEKGVDLLKEDNFDNTPLMYALANNKQSIASLLIEKGVNVDAENSKDITPLQNAVIANDKEAVLYLISHGANINYEIPNPAEKDSVRTALEMAICTGRAEMVSLLITYGADVNYVSKNGDTPLMFAARYGKSDIIPILKEAGAVVQNPQQSNHNISKSMVLSSLTESSPAFTTALVALSKIIAQNGKEIFATENKQKLTGLVSDFLPQSNELYPILKESLQCGFTQILLDANEKNDDKKAEATTNIADKIVTETKLANEEAVLIVRLVTLSLGWE